MVGKAPQRRRRDRSKVDPAAVPSSGGSPTGPAGGDLAGTYPDPRVAGLTDIAWSGDLAGYETSPAVVGLSHVAAGGDLSGTMDAPEVTDLEHAAAGGDLSGWMNAPQVINLSHVTAGGDLSGTMDAPEVTDLEHAAAGGDLSGWMNAPQVVSIANVTTGPVTYPPGSGANLTNIPAPQTLASGQGDLDGSGTLLVNTGQAFQALVATWTNAAGAGILYTQGLGIGVWNIVSNAGAADSGMSLTWIAF